MKNKKIVTISIIFLIIILMAGAVSAANTRLAVIGFESKDNHWDDEKLLEDITSLFNNKLVEIEKFIVLKREKMVNVLEEVKFARGKRPINSVVNQLRHYFNTDFFVYGSLEKVDIKKTNAFEVGPLQFAETEITVKLSVDMINSRTARVSKSYSGSGSASDTVIVISDSQNNENKLELSSQKDIFEKAVGRAVNNLIKKIVEGDADTNPQEITVEAKIKSLFGRKIVIDKGERQGLEVGKNGEIIRNTNNRNVLIGGVEVTDVYSNSAVLKTTYLNYQPKPGDQVIIKLNGTNIIDDNQYSEPVKVLETSDFIIKINDAVKSGNRVTIRGTAYAKINNARLEIILGNRDFYDQNGDRRDMSGRRVAIGDWVNSSNHIASIEDGFQRGEQKNISWSFTGVPAAADKLTQVELWLRTTNGAEFSVALRNLQL